MKPSVVFALSGALVASALALAGCGAPEQCKGCLAALADGSALEAPRVDSPIATGGATGSGGMGTGGAATGGMGTGGAATGGMGTGGAATGGMGTGGAGTGGRGTGGANTGGANTGGANTGGANMGGMATGGRGTGGAGGAVGGMGGAAIDPDLVVWYKFDNNATDSAMLGGTARNATVTSVGGGTAAYSTTRQVGTHALNLGGTSSTVGGYALVPSLQSQLPAGVTIAVWVNVRSNQNWQRVFDFGTTAGTPQINMFLTTNQGAASPNAVRFSISTTGTAGEQSINMSTPAQLPLNTWHHLAVVLPAGATYTGTLYIDGMVAGTNTAMTIHPSALAMPNSYIGRSQWANDPYFNGYIDDFRVYRRALTPAEIAALP